VADQAPETGEDMKQDRRSEPTEPHLAEAEELLEGVKAEPVPEVLTLLARELQSLIDGRTRRAQARK